MVKMKKLSALLLLTASSAAAGSTLAYHVAMLEGDIADVAVQAAVYNVVPSTESFDKAHLAIEKAKANLQPHLKQALGSAHGKADLETAIKDYYLAALAYLDVALPPHVGEQAMHSKEEHELKMKENALEMEVQLNK